MSGIAGRALGRQASDRSRRAAEANSMRSARVGGGWRGTESLLWTSRDNLREFTAFRSRIDWCAHAGMTLRVCASGPLNNRSAHAKFFRSCRTSRTSPASGTG
jgi:hypothetical protein